MFSPYRTGNKLGIRCNYGPFFQTMIITLFVKNAYTCFRKANDATLASSGAMCSIRLKPSRNIIILRFKSIFSYVFPFCPVLLKPLTWFNILACIEVWSVLFSHFELLVSTYIFTLFQPSTLFAYIHSICSSRLILNYLSCIIPYSLSSFHFTNSFHSYFFLFSCSGRVLP